MEDTLIHYGVKGMKWGVRRTPEQLGHKVQQMRNMSDSERKRYAKQRIKERGAEQAIKDEDKRRKIRRCVTSGATMVSHLGLGGITMGAFFSGNVPLAAAAGAGWIAGLGGSRAISSRGDANASKNIQTIARVSGLDKKMKSRAKEHEKERKNKSSNFTNQMMRDHMRIHDQSIQQALYDSQLFNDQAMQAHNMAMQSHFDSMNAINMSTSIGMF